MLQHCYVRGSIADEIKSDDNVCQLLMTATFCGPCSAVQMANTLVARGVPARLGMDDADAYQQKLMGDDRDDL